MAELDDRVALAKAMILSSALCELLIRKGYITQEELNVVVREELTKGSTYAPPTTH